MSRNSPEFSKKCKVFFEAHGHKRDELQKCLEDNATMDVNFTCKAPKAAYLLAICQAFCKPEYDTTVKCQKAAGDEWSSKCFQENVLIGQCIDTTLKKVYVYGMEHHTKNPAAKPT